MSAKTQQFVVIETGRGYEARMKDHTRLRTFAATRDGAISKLRYAIERGWADQGNTGEIFRAIAAKEN